MYLIKLIELNTLAIINKSTNTLAIINDKNGASDNLNYIIGGLIFIGIIIFGSMLFSKK